MQINVRGRPSQHDTFSTNAPKYSTLNLPRQPVCNKGIATPTSPHHACVRYCAVSLRSCITREMVLRPFHVSSHYTCRRGGHTLCVPRCLCVSNNSESTAQCFYAQEARPKLLCEFLAKLSHALVGNHNLRGTPRLSQVTQTRERAHERKKKLPETVETSVHFRVNCQSVSGKEEPRSTLLLWPHCQRLSWTGTVKHELLRNCGTVGRLA